MNKINTIVVESQLGSHVVNFYESTTGKWQYTISLGVVSGLFETESAAQMDALCRIMEMTK